MEGRRDRESCFDGCLFSRDVRRIFDRRASEVCETSFIAGGARVSLEAVAILGCWDPWLVAWLLAV